MTGYSDPLYAASLAEFGTPRLLPKSGGWILERQIPGTPFKDAMGCYPLFSCKDWSKLGEDIKALEGELVSLALVTDPFADISAENLAEIFDVCVKFKDHYIANLSHPIHTFVRKNALKYARSSLKKVSIEHCVNPKEYFAEWFTLYQFLIDRHQISGIRAFSEKSFDILLGTSGLEMFIARFENKVVGAELWLVDRNIGYEHLAAISPNGYKLNASYALHLTVMNYFSKSLGYLDFGSGSGLKPGADGLTWFKRGWTNETKPVYFCGCILDKEKYIQIVQANKLANTNYFPLYRAGEYE